MRKLKHSEIKDCREELLKKQKGIDPITLQKITDPVLDHDHASGRVRAVLQREVNAFEGKVCNAYKRYIRHLGASLEDVLINLIEYHQIDFSENPLHPRHKTPEDKLIREYKRRMKKAKRQSTKLKYKNLINEINEKR